MLVFIVSSLGLCFLVQAGSPWQADLISPVVYDLGMGIAVASLIALLSKKVPTQLCYDIFSAATLLVWFATWKPEFKDDSPMFFAYPLYFVFIASFMALYLIAQADKIDTETLQQMRRYQASSVVLQPWLLMPIVLLSLHWPEHYLLYPTTMTLMLAQAAFSLCLDKKPC